MNLEINNKLQLEKFLNHIVPPLTSIVNNVTKLALPILGAMAISYAPIAKAGMIEYISCIADCYTMERPGEFSEYGLLACIASCAFYKMN